MNTNEKEKQLTGYPSIDKPWLKYYSEEAINAPLPECTMYEYLWENNKNHLDDIALIYFGKKITYGEMFENIEKTARAFTAIGVREGDIVILCTVTIPETVYCLYALNRIGAIANFIDPRTSESGIRSYINESKADVLLTVDMTYPVIQNAVKNTGVKKVIVVSISDSLNKIERMAYKLKNKESKLRLDSDSILWKKFIEQGKGTVITFPLYKKDRLIILAHTGGTTGTSKSVMLSDDNLNSVVHSYKFLGIPFERQQKYFDDLPPFIIYGITIPFHVALCYGQKIKLYPVFDSKKFSKIMKKYKPNHFSDTPEHLKYLIEATEVKHLNCSFLISAGVGGDSLNKEMEQMVNNWLEKHNCQYKLCKGYGMTELSATAVISTPLANAIGSVGIPLVHNNLRIVDVDTGLELQYNQTGEIWVSSPSIMLGYYNNREETDKLISVDSEGRKWLRTGDLGYVNDEGLLFLEGRIKRIYLVEHENAPAKLFPLQVEEALRKVDVVMDCVVVGKRQTDSFFYKPIAFVILKDGKLIDREMIVRATEIADGINSLGAVADICRSMKKMCEEIVPNYMLPVEYWFVQEFPHTPVGKIDYRALERLAEEYTNENETE